MLPQQHKLFGSLATRIFCLEAVCGQKEVRYAEDNLRAHEKVLVELESKDAVWYVKDDRTVHQVTAEDVGLHRLTVDIVAAQHGVQDESKRSMPCACALLNQTNVICCCDTSNTEGSKRGD